MSSESTCPFLKFPIDLRAHVLYDAYQRISTEKSHENYEKLCEAMGNEAISYEEYETLYNQYLEKDKRELPDIRGCILSDVTNGKLMRGSSRDVPNPDIRGCILSDIINGKTAEKSIDDLCDALKNQKIDKEDHDYWFKRFGSGHLFTRKTFSDFPEDIFAEIVDRCDMKSYLNLRNVSFGLRTVIDQLAPPCNDIKVNCEEDWIIVHSNNARITDSEYFNKTKSKLPLSLIEKQSLKTLELLLRNPKLRLKSFKFVPNPLVQKSWRMPIFGSEVPPRDYKKHFFDFLNSLHHKIHVEKCVVKVKYERGLIRILQCMKPGTLEHLDIDMGFLNGRISEVMNMDQWKLAKHLKIHTYELPPIESFFHFSTFELEYPPITLENMVKLCENASISNNFEYCKVEIQGRFELETIKRVLNLQPTASPQIHSIPNTNLVIQLIDFHGFESYKIYKE